jgi:nucleoside-diphosphate-sugar epimerase
MSGIPLPAAVANEAQLEELLGAPSPADVAFARALTGDVLVVGAGGKMGPSLARRTRRAVQAAGGRTRVVAVSRFSSPELREDLERDGIETLACDLLDPAQVEALPDAANVLYLSGMKFGSQDRPDLTWAQNTIAAAHVARRYARSRIVAFSTGNVYPFVDPASGGSTESDPPAPVGEYAQSCLGRERVFEYFSRERGTPSVLFRLFYAVDLRYGTLVDIARKVAAGEVVDLAVGHVNAIWQGDANSYALRSLGLGASPPRVLNVTGPAVSVREAAAFFAARLGRPLRTSGVEGPYCLLGNAARCQEALGPPEVPLPTLLEWCAAWVERGGRSLGKPTKFERADGRF